MKPGLIILLLLSAFYASPQNYEFGLMLGTMHYMGDLTETPIKLRDTKCGAGVLFRYNFRRHLNLKVNLLYGEISGADSLKAGFFNAVNNSVSTKWAKYRNLSFKSYIIDGSIELEYNILPFVSGDPRKNWTPYLLAGVAVFAFNPKAKYNGKWYELQPLGTEGQGTLSPHAEEKYNLTQLAIPYGIGIKYSFKPPGYYRRSNLYLWNIGFEISNRKTFTDHLDDVGGYYPDYQILRTSRGPDGAIAVALSDRQAEILSRLKKPGDAVPKRESGTIRGNPDKKDQYMFMGFTITRTFRPIKYSLF